MVRTWVAAAAGIGGIVAGALLGPAVTGTSAEAAGPADTALADRIAIEDLVTRYYAHLGTDDAGAFGDYYTENASFDVNGIVATGKQEIEALYADIGGDPDSNTAGGVFHMVLSNPVIDVNGDSATASFLWTGILNPDPKEPPRVSEHGREYDRLVKRDGKWLIEKRVVIADSALPARYQPTYQPRLNYDISASN
jgi:ketosteroid isomerase-like protein